MPPRDSHREWLSLVPPHRVKTVLHASAGTSFDGGMTDAELSALWRAYVRDRAQLDLRNCLWEHYLPFVRDVAWRLKRRLVESVDLEDLAAVGNVGLLAAIESFDPGRGIKFKSFSYRRVRGAMIDSLRTADRISRSMRRDQRRLVDARNKMQVQLGRPPTAEQTAAALGMTDEEYWRFQAAALPPGLVSLDRLPGSRGTWRDKADPVERGDILADPRAADPRTGERNRSLLRAVAKGLSERERLLVILYYSEGLTFREIGPLLQISDSRLSQMHTALIERLRDRKTEFEGAD